MLFIGLVLLVIVAPTLIVLFCRMQAEADAAAVVLRERNSIPAVAREFDPDALLVDMAQRDRVRGDRLV